LGIVANQRRGMVTLVTEVKRSKKSKKSKGIMPGGMIPFVAG
jgi:hypothetical protein